MPNFRKKPIVVEAKQWWPPGMPGHDESMLSFRKGSQVDPPDYRRVGDLYCAVPSDAWGLGGSALYKIKTLNGDLCVSPGEWIITGINGEKYPCNDEIFKKTYDPVDSWRLPDCGETYG